MKRIRIGNDFTFTWDVNRAGNPENLEAVENLKVILNRGNTSLELENYEISNNRIIIHFNETLINTIGIYNIELSYVVPAFGEDSINKKYTTDVDAFKIVSNTADANNIEELSIINNVSIDNILSDLINRIEVLENILNSQ